MGSTRRRRLLQLDLLGRLAHGRAVSSIVKSSQPTLGTKDVNGVKTALAHGPLVTTMTVYGDFIAYSGGIYKHVTGDSLGGHAIAIVGYDDAGRYWIVRNNWGADWGEAGFFRVSWDDVSGIGEETWSYEVPQAQGYVSVGNPHGRKFVSGTSERWRRRARFRRPPRCSSRSCALAHGLSTESAQLRALSLHPDFGHGRAAQRQVRGFRHRPVGRGGKNGGLRA